MKRLLALLLAAALLLSMSGCALLYDSTDTEFRAQSANPLVDPGEDDNPNGENDLPDDPADEDGDGEDTANAITDTGVVGGYYYCDDYKFPMPEKWLGAIEVVITEKQYSSGKYTVIIRNYYYVQLDGVKAKIMTIASVPYAYSKYYTGATLLCYSKDKTMAFMQQNHISSLPDGFTDVGVFSDIFEEIGKSSFSLTPMY